MNISYPILRGNMFLNVIKNFQILICPWIKILHHSSFQVLNQLLKIIFLTLRFLTNLNKKSIKNTFLFKFIDIKIFDYQTMFL